MPKKACSHLKAVILRMADLLLGITTKKVSYIKYWDVTEYSANTVIL